MHQNWSSTCSNRAESCDQMTQGQKTDLDHVRCVGTRQNRRSSRRLEDMTEDMVSRHMNSCLIKHETEHVSENFTNL